ncbi:hypothetical protein CYMTET_3112 [Cymbomonas tetramitiformis]|uniref:Uncharacterized protein n=1 Tax=Cymbomonas tetramitiformis TaxID=36881 RepID=A0AAE0H3Z6_9CHLO|nr:hypothetical protein CYMTET_3112 [Cymbomonas tetramitiformis]
MESEEPISSDHEDSPFLKAPEAAACHTKQVQEGDNELVDAAERRRDATQNKRKFAEDTPMKTSRNSGADGFKLHTSFEFLKTPTKPPKESRHDQELQANTMFVDGNKSSPLSLTEERSGDQEYAY